MTCARFSPQPQRDLGEIFNFIARDNSEAAEQVRLTILNTADLLAQRPDLGRNIRKAQPRHAQIRWSVVPRFRNYLIFYQPYQSTIIVVRVLHAARDWTRFFLSSSNPSE